MFDVNQSAKAQSAAFGELLQAVAALFSETPDLHSEGRGVYVLSSSRAGEDSYADTDSTGEVRPSAFTAEVIEALRAGKVGKDGKGDVSVEDLFHYVNRRMRAQGARQVPVKFAHAVDDRIVIADCPLGAAPLLTPLTRRPAASCEQPAQGSTRKSGRPQPSWPQLLDYYRECVLSDETETPLMPVGDRETSYVCLAGEERLLSGEGDDGCVPIPAEADPLIEYGSSVPRWVRTGRTAAPCPSRAPTH